MYVLINSVLDIDEKLDKRDLALVKISDTGAGEEYGEEWLEIGEMISNSKFRKNIVLIFLGIEELPSLVYFENGVPEIFEGS